MYYSWTMDKKMIFKNKYYRLIKVCVDSTSLLDQEKPGHDYPENYRSLAIAV